MATTEDADKNVTVKDINESFVQKGLFIKLPLDENLLVKGIDILEKQQYPGGIKVLLRVKFVDDQGVEKSDLFYCEGRMEKERKPVAKPAEPLKVNLLPTRSQGTFTDEQEARNHLKMAITHLIQEKGYSPAESPDSELYFEKGEKGLFVNLEVKCDEKAEERSKELVALRRKKGSTHDYAIVIPAFQESLGISLRFQERWIARNQDYLSVQRIGVFAVDNIDPNRIYPFTIYPKDRGLMQYFVRMSSQWALVRSRYVQKRVKKEPT
jgi:hypothetical protein